MDYLTWIFYGLSNPNPIIQSDIFLVPLQHKNYMKINKDMCNKEYNLTQFFTDYLNNKSELNATNIKMACYSALNSIDSSLNVAEVVYNMRNDFEYINKVIDDLARSINKSNSYENIKQRKPASSWECLTIPEIHSIYGISQQAIRKACKEGRIPFKEGFGKNKYLIAKVDVELYMAHAKSKQK